MKRSVVLKILVSLLVVFCLASLAEADPKPGKGWKKNKHKNYEYHNGVYVVEHPGKGWYAPRPDRGRRVIVVQPSGLYYVRVTAVLAGNLVRVSFGDGYAPQIVRLIGSDLMVGGNPWYDDYRRDARAYTSRSLRGRKIWLQLSGGDVWDAEGRMLGYVWLSRPVRYDEHEAGRYLFNRVLLSNGYARMSVRYPANDRYRSFMYRSQVEAREARRGYWRHY